MTKEEIRAARDTLGQSAKRFGIAIGYAENSAGRSVRRLEAGDRKASGAVVKLIHGLLVEHYAREKERSERAAHFAVLVS